MAIDQAAHLAATNIYIRAFTFSKNGVQTDFGSLGGFGNILRLKGVGPEQRQQ